MVREREVDEVAADRRFARLFEDLEAQEEGRALHERLGEFSDLVAGEAADHALADRFAGALGERIALSAAGDRFDGRIVRASSGWVVLAMGAGDEVLVALEHVDEVRLAARSHVVPDEDLSLASPLRTWSEERVVCAIAVVGAAGDVRMLVGRIALVAQDYIEVGEDVGYQGAAASTPVRGMSGATAGRVLIPQARIAHVRPTGGAR